MANSEDLTCYLVGRYIKKNYHIKFITDEDLIEVPNGKYSAFGMNRERVFVVWVGHTLVVASVFQNGSYVTRDYDMTYKGEEGDRSVHYYEFYSYDEYKKTIAKVLEMMNDECDTKKISEDEVIKVPGAYPVYVACFGEFLVMARVYTSTNIEVETRYIN